jgi:hypothetical protein
VEHIRWKDNVVADTLSRFPPDVDAAVTRNVNLPIVGATLTSEKQFITALFMSSGLDELKAHFRNLRQLQLDDPFLGPIFRTRVQDNEPEAHLRHFRIHQDILIFFHPSDGLSKIAHPETLMESIIGNFHKQYGHFGISTKSARMYESIFNAQPNDRGGMGKLVGMCLMRATTFFFGKVLFRTPPRRCCV